MIQKKGPSSSKADARRTRQHEAGTRPMDQGTPPALREFVNMIVEALARRWIEHSDHDKPQKTFEATVKQE